MAMDDLFQALNAFKSGVNELQTSRVIQGANEQVQQIHASELSDAEKRNQLTALSHQLVGQMGALGAPVSDIQQQAANVAPHVLKDANAMNQEALLTGNSSMGAAATKQQAFENNAKFELAKIKAQARFNPLAMAKAEEAKNEFDVKQLKGYQETMDASKASSRSQFGQWAATAGRGDRLQSVLGDPNKWKSMTAPELELVTEGLVNMSKGGAMTKEEHSAMNPFMAQVAAAKAQTAVTGKPVALDLSGFAGLYNGVINREEDASKEKMFDIMMNKAHGNSELGKRPGAANGYKNITASSLAQLGIQVDPSGISIDPKTNKVIIPELKPVMDAMDKAPQLVTKAMKDAKAGNPEAQKMLQAYGITQDMSPVEAANNVRRHIKRSLFR